MTRASSPLAVVILAAGLGKRMNDPTKAKVMHELAGRPLIEHVLGLATAMGADPIIVVVGHQRETVIRHIHSCTPAVRIAIQEQQLGTGHAILQTAPLLTGYHGDVLILSGDVPLTRLDTLTAMAEAHRESGAVVTVMTARFDDPTGYGRVIRNAQGTILRIVEHKDATEDEKSITEINSGIYIFRCAPLFDALQYVTNDNAQGEYYLPDVFSTFASQGLPMLPFVIDDPVEIQGVNTIDQLQALEAEYHSRQHLSTT